MTEATELSERSSNPSIKEKAVKLHSEWEKVSEGTKEILAQLDLEVQEYISYHTALQDAEKWLLQISFQLMAYNSLYITSHDQVSELMEQHEVRTKSKTQDSFSLFVDCFMWLSFVSNPVLRMRASINCSLENF